MPTFRRSNSNQAPTEDEIHSAARQLQQGGLRGRGSSRKADKLVAQAGDDGQAIAFRILDAAIDYEPRKS